MEFGGLEGGRDRMDAIGRGVLRLSVLTALLSADTVIHVAASIDPDGVSGQSS
jgi:hypothetical protein